MGMSKEELINKITDIIDEFFKTHYSDYENMKESYDYIMNIPFVKKLKTENDALKKMITCKTSNENTIKEVKKENVKVPNISLEIIEKKEKDNELEEEEEEVIEVEEDEDEEEEEEVIEVEEEEEEEEEEEVIEVE